MLSFLGLTLMVLVATLGLARWSFERGFLDYVNALEQTRLTLIGENLGRLYVEHDRQWSNVEEETLQISLSMLPRPDTVAKAGRPLEVDFLLPPKGRRPPPFESYDFPPPKDFEGSARPPGGPGGRRPRRGGPSYPPTALYDLQGAKIFGHVLNDPSVEIIDFPVVVDTEVVAILKSAPVRQVSSSIETAFSRQQWMTSVFIGIASLLLAGLVAFGLTRLLVSPVHRMIQGVNRLSKGDYSQPLVSTYNDEFGLLVEDINYLSKTLEKNRSARSRWLANISHELRTPLAILTGEIEALKDGIRPFGPEQLVSLDQETKRLRYLVDDLYELSLSDIGGLRYEFALVDLTQSIKQTIKSHRLAAEEKGITVTFDKDASVLISADEKRINQLLSNLMRNSLAYTNTSGRVEITLKTDDYHAILAIHDTPPGIDLADCSLLFEPLYRKDESRNSRSSGAGLGLSICRNIVEAHRGEINAAPSPLGGVLMTLELPLLKGKGKS
ncbi:ATP-binding protein [Leucothrix arctica]|nr:ATP-binding protein [Leucothrix arctica]